MEVDIEGFGRNRCYVRRLGVGCGGIGKGPIRAPCLGLSRAQGPKGPLWALRALRAQYVEDMAAKAAHH